MKTFINTPAAYQLFHEGSIALSQVEANGIKVDTDYLNKTIDKISADIKEKQKQLKADEVWKLWKKIYGDKASLGSRPQLVHIIFEQLGYDRRPSMQTESGEEEGGDEAAFSDVDLPFIKAYFEIEKLKKVHGTYLLGIRRELMDGFIHPSFNLNIARTFRSSCDNPNFQNIPVRNQIISEMIRKCYVARDPDHYDIGEVDMAGAEVRTSCAYHKDPRLIHYVEDETTDMHRDMACQIFNLKPEQVDKKGPRDCSKNMFVFPEFYGSVYFQCAPNMWESMEKRKFRIKDTDILVKDHLAKQGITKLGDCTPGGKPKPGTFAYQVKKAEDYLWNETFTQYTAWKKSWYRKYQKEGGFTTLSGFAVHGFLARNDVLNYPIQGSAFHCLLWCLIRIQKWLNKNKMKTKIIGQIHDSIVCDIYRKEREVFLAKCKQVFTVDLPKAWKWINVPIAIEAEVAPPGGSWFEKKVVALP